MLLTLLGLAFVGGLGLQRQRSGFLRAEARAGEARALGARHGVAGAQVLALHEQLGGSLTPQALEQAVARFAAAREQLAGVALLAALAVRGQEALARQLLHEARGDPRRAAALALQHRAAAPIAGRFASVAERYAARGH